MDYSTLDDAALIAILAEPAHRKLSDPVLSAVIAALYDRYGRLIYTVAIHVVDNAETAEEITQDVFMRAWESAYTYRPGLAKVSSWLVSIARHRAIDELRRAGIRPEKDRVDWTEEAETNLSDPFPITYKVEESVENSLEQRVIRQMIAELPPDQRQVLSLAFFDGLSHSEISARLGEPLGTVKSRIRLAMLKLRDGLVENGAIDV